MTVEFIAQYRMADLCHMNPNLMIAAGIRLTGDDGDPLSPLQDRYPGFCGTLTDRIGFCGHQYALTAWKLTNLQFDDAFIKRNPALYQSDLGFLQSSVLKVL